jgi:hypothetical protein
MPIRSLPSRTEPRRRTWFRSSFLAACATAALAVACAEVEPEPVSNEFVLYDGRRVLAVSDVASIERDGSAVSGEGPEAGVVEASDRTVGVGAIPLRPEFAEDAFQGESELRGEELRKVLERVFLLEQVLHEFDVAIAGGLDGDGSIEAKRERVLAELRMRREAVGAQYVSAHRAYLRGMLDMTVVTPQNDR